MAVTALDRILGLNGKTMAIFFRQLATMHQAGMPWTKTMAALQSQFKNNQVGRLVTDLIPSIDGGMPIAEAFARFPFYFSPFVISIIEAGEKGGTLDVRLKELADHLEQVYKDQLELVGKLVYPILLVHAGILIPPVVVAFTDGPHAYLVRVLPVLIALYVLAAIVFFVRRFGEAVVPARRALDAVVASTPFISKLVKLSASMWFLRALGQLYDSGIPPGRAVTLAARSCGNSFIGGILDRSAPRLEGGESMASALGATNILPAASMQMLVAGEQSGQMGMMLKKAADLIEIDVRAASQAVATIVPTLIFLFIAANVAYTVVTMYQGYITKVMNP